MATQVINYCNASNGINMDISYNDVTHAVTGHSPVSYACNLVGPGYPGLAAGSVIYQHTEGSTVYKVRVQNTAPYAYVTSEAAPTCSIVIDSVGVTNATNETTSDGALTINATGNGAKSYSLNGGFPQSSNVFTGLAPGVYVVRVTNYTGVLTCYAFQNVAVGYDAISVCDLALGNIQYSSGPGGTITVQDYSASVNETVEYRLDSGTWQDSPNFTGLANGTYNVQIRFKNFTSCSDDRNVTIGDDCDIVLAAINITHEQSKDGSDGVIEIIATTSNTPIQYSKDDGSNYQSSNIFTSLAPGSYDIRIKDALSGCEAFATVAVKKYRAPYVEFPVANGPRVVVTGGNTYDANAKQNFDNRLFSAMRFKDVSPCEYFQKYSTDDLINLQWRTSFLINTVKVFGYDDDLLKATLTPYKKTTYFDKTDVLTASFSDYGANQTQVYFPDIGLPSFIKIGMNITISGVTALNGTYEVDDIVNGTGQAEGYLVLLITKVFSGSDPSSGSVTVTYDQEDFEVWEVTFDPSALSAGKYYLLFEGTDGQFGTYTGRSEPLQTLADVSDLVKVTYKNYESAFKIDYTTGISHLLRLEGELVYGTNGGEREEMEDSRRRLINLRENVTRNPQFNADGIPPYLAEKLRVAFAHDYFTVEDVECQKSEELKTTLHHEAGDPLCTVSCALRQIDFIAENGDDTGDVDGTLLELDGGTLMELDI